MKNKKKSYESGLTLIELMIVVAIIGILTTLASQNYIQYKKNIRDSIRVIHVAKIKRAMKNYFDEYGNYPKTYGIATTNFPPSWASSANESWEIYRKSLLHHGLDFPKDPLNTKDSLKINHANSWAIYGALNYSLFSNGEFYIIIYGLEKEGIAASKTKSISSCSGASYIWGAERGGVTDGESCKS